MLMTTTRRIAIFGGAFDPITIFHLNIAKGLTKHFDHVWIQPCYHHATKKHLVAPHHRLAMCNLALKDLDHKYRDKIHISDYEIKNKLTGQSFDILNQLIQESPHIHYSLVLGADNATKITTWNNWPQLTQLINIVVVPRDNITLSLNYNYTYLSQIIGGPGSSTQVRSLLKQNNLLVNPLVNSLVSNHVLQYIINNSLYQ